MSIGSLSYRSCIDLPWVRRFCCIADSAHGSRTRRALRSRADYQNIWLRTFETIVDTIGNTRTASGLRVKAQLDKRKYPKGVVTTKDEMQALSLHPQDFHGEWNYELRPR